MAGSNSQIYQFGPFRLHAGDRVLLCEDRTVHLTEKVFNVLLLLVQKSGHLVTKEELMEQVWPDSIVEENNLTVSMSALRRALAESEGGSNFIETVSKRGYRFVGNVLAPRVEPGQPHTHKHEPPTSKADALNSATTLAVLPLMNVSDDPGLEYLSDGITESIINSLSKLPQLKVLARSTMFRFKGNNTDPLEIGRQLETNALLTGRILQIDDELIVKLELLNVQEGTQIWGEQYKRNLSDIFEVQEEISQEVSEKLKLRLTREQKRQLTKRYTEDIEAYHLYLKGRYCWNKRTGEALKMAIEFFQRAIAKDPDYALAYTGLADCYAIIAFYSNVPPKPAFEEAKKATAKALEIDDSLAEAHASLAFVKEYYDWDWKSAGKEYRRAIELNPNYPTARQWYGMYFMKLGQFERARRELKGALRFDPRSLIINTDLGLPAYFTGQYEEAIEQYRRVLEIDRDFIWARFFLGWAYERSGRFSEAVSEFEKAKLIDARPEVSAMTAHTYAVSGNRSEAISILNNLEEQAKHHYISPYYVALVFAGLGDKDMAFRWLEKAYSDRNEWLVWLKVDPRFESLGEDPRFIDLLRRIGFLESTADESAGDSDAAPKIQRSNDGFARALVAMAYLEKGLFEEAIRELSHQRNVSQVRETLALLGYAYAASGKPDEARAALEDLEQRAPTSNVDPAFIALVHGALQNNDRAFELLELAHERRSPGLALLSTSSLFESLRPDPRYETFLRRTMIE